MCNKNRDISNYYIKKNSKDGFDNLCKDCTQIKNNLYQDKKNKYFQKYSIQYNYISPTKTCATCKEIKNKNEFYSKKINKDGFDRECKVCSSKRKKKSRQIKSSNKNKYSIKYFYISPTKKCKICKKTKKLSEFYIDRKYTYNLKKHCKSCADSQNKNYLKKTIRYGYNWQKFIISNIKKSNSIARLSEKYDKDFNLEAMSEITIDFLTKLKEKQNNKCNWFGVDIDFSRNDWLRSPSLDRLDNDKGYTRDNVVLTCRSANLARNKSTVEEMGNFLSELKNSILSKEIA
jgi:hypothetical protein|tara:strand:- start:32 stop:898 length:867 start_codon:yes stop_codon:yes gene_type:complete